MQIQCNSINVTPFSNSVRRIINATRQVVSGELLKIGAEFGSADDESAPSVVCVVEIWSRKWLDSEEYTMRCDDSKEYTARNKRSLHYDSRHIDSQYEPQPISPAEMRLEHQFSAFETMYNRKYGTIFERNNRRKIFSENLERISELNRLEQGTASYGVNQFADLTEAEFSKYKGLNERTESNELRNPMADIPNKGLPKSFDWRDKNVISPVKNQGQCGSCWAFSVIGNIEGLNAIKTGKLEEFSEQELVDCDTIDSGCNGGLFDNAYK